MSFIAGFRIGMQEFGNKIATIINTILLLFVYLIAVGPTSLVARITGKRFLETKKKKDSYWQDLSLGKQRKEEYYRQF